MILRKKFKIYKSNYKLELLKEKFFLTEIQRDI
jgi:hypothetical protein